MDNKRGAQKSSVNKAHLPESTTTNGSKKGKERKDVPLYPTNQEVTEASKPQLRGPLMDHLDSTSLCSSPTNSASTGASGVVADAIRRIQEEIDDCQHQQQQQMDEEMGRIRAGSLYPSPLTAEAAAASHEDEEPMFPMEIKPEQQQQQQSSEQFALNQHTSEATTTNATDTSGGDDLVRATLIRDADDTSHHSNTELEWVSNTNTNQSTRAISSAAVAVESDIAVVEAKPVDVAPSKTMSRKLICAVMGMLLLVIAALSVGFVVSAQRQEDDSNNSSSANDDEDGFTSNNENATTQRPTSTIEESLQDSSISPSVVTIPVLERLKQGEPLRCGVNAGPGLFHPNEVGEPFGFDAALVRQVASKEIVEEVPCLQTLTFCFHSIFSVCCCGSSGNRGSQECGIYSNGLRKHVSKIAFWSRRYSLCRHNTYHGATGISGEKKGSARG
jgi:hypothetical protein